MIQQLDHYAYVNFDDERLYGIENMDDVLSAIHSIYDNPKTLLLDEIQNIPRWELVLNRLQRQGYNLIVTGSNSNLLSAELATHLTGRHVPILLFPFSFKEVVHTRNQPLTSAETKETLQHYSKEGGFPEPIIKAIDYEGYLQNLVHAVIYKDIVKRYQIRFVQGMEDLAHYLFSNTAKEYSFRTLAQVTKCKSPSTVEKYLGYLEGAFLFFSIKRYSHKVKEQVSTNKKCYCIDNGLATALGFRFSPDKGRLYENLVAIALYKRELEHELRIFFWKNQQQEEVDFVVKRGLHITQLIQVCCNINDPKTYKRETRALLKASKELSCEDLLVLTEDVEKEESVTHLGVEHTIRFVPIHTWLLNA